MRCALILGVLAATLAGSGCTRVNPDYCDPATTDACDPGYRCDPLLNTCVPAEEPADAGPEAGGDGPRDGGGDTEVGCAGSSECSDPAKPICVDGACQACGNDDECLARDATRPACVSGQCLECSTWAHCTTAALPLCGADHTCRACARDVECQQGPQPQVGVCAAGACPGPDDVLWVDDSGGSCPGNGSLATPYCVLADAVTAARTDTRKTIVVRAGTYGFVALKNSGLVGLLVVGFLGDEVIVQGDASNPAVDIDLSGTLTLRRLHLKGVGLAGGTTAVLQCATAACTGEELEIDTGGVGVLGSNTGLLTLVRSRVHHNVAGGIRLSDFSSYVIENNFIWSNGNPNSLLGGVSFASSFGTMRFVNNTVYGNRVDASLVAGVHCDSSSVVTTNNILWENRNDTGLAETDATGGCTITYSVIDDPTIASTNNNRGNNPQFANLLSDPIDLHLTAASGSALGGADPTQAPSDDIDGDPRPSGGPTDIGADQR